ncbi:hypothetical protein ACB092_09G074200 [Castanea dentata]
MGKHAQKSYFLSLWPPHCITGAHVKRFVYGVTTMESNNILRSRNIWSGGTIN